MLIKFVASIASILVLTSCITPTKTPLPPGITALQSDYGNISATDSWARGGDVLAVGEAAHTSEGFYQAKFALMKYLVENHRVRTIAFEDSFTSLESIDDFIQRDQGDAQTALNQAYRVWHSETIRQMLIWLRDFNRANPEDKVRFVGFDLAEEESLKAWEKGGRDGKRELANLSRSYSNRRTEAAGNASMRNAIRDEAMAKILRFWIDGDKRGAKTYIWTANGHINKLALDPKQKPMGQYLSEDLGVRLKTLQIVAQSYDVYPGWKLTVPQVKPAPGSPEEWLSSFGQERLFVNLGELNPAELGLTEATRTQATAFVDSFIYLRHSPAMQLSE